jgi:DNA-binding HxlR family transcriptional regulator
MKIKSKQQGIKVVVDVLDSVSGKWRGQILTYLCDAPERFNEIKTVLNNITSSTLTKELRYYWNHP